MTNNLIKCEKCGFDISKKAKQCPRCYNATTLEVMDNCRSCGKKLVRNNHFSKYFSTYMKDGTTTRGKYIIEHTPCPYCGDPKPLLVLECKRSAKYLVAGIIFSILTGILLFLILNTVPGPNSFFKLAGERAIATLAAGFFFVMSVLTVFGAGFDYFLKNRDL